MPRHPSAARKRLERLREGIDAIDLELVRLLARRAKLARRAMAARAAASGTFRVRNRAREAELRALWRARARRLGLDPRATERVFAAVLASSRPQKKNGRA